ncbi:Predicted N-acetyltransferase YhbS [Cnuella takakiae]|uniref:Predicted N-acetyltransferase YhbS n=1 Tax=Cnuella takakiae TaxID=1302690 RepID=A0A1M5BNE7_9BACT|nr:GNAT family N-acetyltransferase [Cnuella takakiae]OLY93446.1 GNAT family N-acetyltransferase [Cnuella takakiae]SHF43747.1 Predicted N-acetyltransferase YhbS [Cnuella takakiae]
MSTTFTISAATKQDIMELDKLVNSAYRGDSSRAGWTTEADLLDGIRITAAGLNDILNKPGATILKATDQAGALAGCVYLEQQPDAMYLGMLTVNPQLQNSGIGKQLMYAGEDLAKKGGIYKMRMTVISVRDTLIAWYQRHGYHPTGEKQPFPNDPKFGLPKQQLEFIVMEKELNR